MSDRHRLSRCIRINPMKGLLRLESWIVLLGLLGALSVTSGCGGGAAVLPPLPKSSANLQFTPTSLPDAVQGRKYMGVDVQTTGGSTILSNCVLSSTFMNAGFAAQHSGSLCVLSASSVSAKVSSLTGTLNATDTLGHTAFINLTLNVRPEFTINDFHQQVVDGVAGRTYTNTITVTTNLSSMMPAATTQPGQMSPNGNGPISACNATVSGTSGITASTCTFSGNSASFNLSGTASQSAGGTPFTVTASITDTAITTVVPDQTWTNFTQSQPQQAYLTVRKEFTFTPTSLADGVQNRTYGVSGKVQAEQTNLSAKAQPAVTPYGSVIPAGNGPIAAAGCSVTPKAPADPGLTATVDPTNTQCLLQSTSSSGLSAANTYSVTVTASDNPISSPSGQKVVPYGNVPNALDLHVQSPISFSLSDDNYNNITAQVPDAVQNRSYGSTASGKSPLTVTANGGLLSTQGLEIVQSGLPTSISCSPSTPTYQKTTATLACSSSDVTDSPGTFKFTVTVSDPGNTATPSGTTSMDAHSNPSHNLTIDSALSFSLAQTGLPNNPPALLDGVEGRSYGLTGTPTYTATGGLGSNGQGSTYYQWCLSQGSLPKGFVNTGSNLNTPCTSLKVANSVTLQANPTITSMVTAPTAFPFTVQLADKGNATTPAGTLTNATSLTVHPQLAAALTQNGNSMSTDPSSLLQGVLGRSYGVIGGTPTFTESATGGGLGSGTYLWCLPTGTLPGGFTGYPGSTCGVSTSTKEDSFTLSAAKVSGTATTFSNIVAEVGDAGNAAVPDAFSSTTTASTPVTSINIGGALVASCKQNGAACPSSLLTGVANRSYGVINSNAAAVTYSGSGGLGSSSYLWCYTGTLPPGFSGAPSSTCGTTGSTLEPGFSVTANPATGAGTFPNIVAELGDAGNPAVPGSFQDSTTSSTAAVSITIGEPLLAQFCQNGTGACNNNPPTLLPGVIGRSYGVVNSGAGAPNYVVATPANNTDIRGLGSGTYLWCLIGNLPGAFGGASTVCGPASGQSTQEDSFLLTANPKVTGSGQQTFSGIEGEVGDAGNAAVPDSFSVKGASSTTPATSITIDAALSATLSQNKVANPTSLLPAVTEATGATKGRSYGVINNDQGALVYSATGGLGSYLWCLPGPIPGGFAPAPSSACSLTKSTAEAGFTLTANPYVTGASGSFNMQGQVDDAGNAAVPDSISSGTSGKTPGPPMLTVEPALSNNCKQSGSLCSTILTGVVKRSYGVMTKMSAAPTFTASGGLPDSSGNYLWCVIGATVPGGFNLDTTTGPCVLTTETSTMSPAKWTASTNGGPADTYSLTGEVDDNGNIAVPDSISTGTSGLTSPFSFPVNAPLNFLDCTQNNVTCTTLLPGVVGRSYGLIGEPPTFTASGGLLDSQGRYLWCVTGKPAPGGFNLDTMAAPCVLSSETPSVSPALYTANSVSGSKNTFMLTPEVDDAGNNAVPDSISSSTSGIGTQFTLPMNAALSITCAQQGADCTKTQILDGVLGRTYGAKGAPAQTTFTGTGGLPDTSNNYLWCVTPSVTGNPVPGGFNLDTTSSACALASETSTKSPATWSASGSGGISGSATKFMLVGEVDDNGNGAVPASITSTGSTSGKTQTFDFQVNPALSVTCKQSGVTCSTNLFDGVLGRSYGVIGAPPTYSATGGLPDTSGNYLWCLMAAQLQGWGFSGPSSTCSPSQSTPESGFSLIANPVSKTGSAGSASLDPEVDDDGNNAVPASSFSMGAGSTSGFPPMPSTLTIDSEIEIANANPNKSGITPLSNGELNDAYSVLLSCEIGTTMLCGGTGNPDNAKAMFTWTANPNNVPGVDLTLTNAIPQPGTDFFAGTPTTVGPTQTVTLAVQDDGNTATPSCDTAGTCPTLAASVDVFPSMAFVGSSTIDNGVLPVDTSTTGLTMGTAIILPNNSTSNQLATSPNATDFFVADPSRHQVYVVDSQTNVPVAKATGLDAGTNDTLGVSVGPQTAPGTPGYDLDSVYAYVANGTSDDVQVIDGDPSHTTGFGKLKTTTDFTLSGTSSNPVALAITPTAVLNKTTRETRLYVLRQDTHEVCIIDAEPTSATFLTQVPPATGSGNGDNCIGLATDTTPAFITVSPDGLYAFVTEKLTAGGGQVEAIDTEAGSITQDQLLASSPVALPPVCKDPQQPGVTVDGQSVFVPCGGTGGNDLVLIQTVSVGTTQFMVGPAVIPQGTDNEPQAITFRPDGKLAVATLLATDSLLPIQLMPLAVDPPVSTAPFATPAGITHVPNASLQITTVSLPEATHGEAYESSVVGSGGTQAYTFSDVNNTFPTLGLLLSPDGKVSGSSVADLAGSHSILVEVDDSSTPVVNKVQKTITLTIK